MIQISKRKITRNRQKEKGFHVWSERFLSALPCVNFIQKHLGYEIPSLAKPEPLLFPPGKVHREELHLLLGDTVSTSLSKSNSLVLNGSCVALVENSLASWSQ